MTGSEDAFDLASRCAVPVLSGVLANLRNRTPLEVLANARAVAGGDPHVFVAVVIARSPLELVEAACAPVIGVRGASRDHAVVAAWLREVAALVIALPAPCDVDATPSTIAAAPLGELTVHDDAQPVLGRLETLACELADACGGLVVDVAPLTNGAGMFTSAVVPWRVVLTPDTVARPGAYPRSVLAHELGHAVMALCAPDVDRASPRDLRERYADTLARRLLAPGARPTLERARGIAVRLVATFAPEPDAAPDPSRARAELAGWLWWRMQPLAGVS